MYQTAICKKKVQKLKQSVLSVLLPAHISLLLLGVIRNYFKRKQQSIMHMHVYVLWKNESFEIKYNENNWFLTNISLHESVWSSLSKLKTNCEIPCMSLGRNLANEVFANQHNHENAWY